jgi:hypothetical protein
VADPGFARVYEAEGGASRFLAAAERIAVRTSQRERRDGEGEAALRHADELVDEGVEESFPASDVPAASDPTQHIGPPRVPAGEPARELTDGEPRERK